MPVMRAPNRAPNQVVPSSLISMEALIK